MKTLIILCLAGMSFSLGCDSDPNSIQGYGFIMPLAVGNEWCHETEFFSLDTTFTGCLTLNDITMIEGSLCYYDTSDVYGNDLPSPFYHHDTIGLWIYWCGDITGGCRKVLTAPYPARLGDSYILDTMIDERLDTIVSTIRVVSTDTLVRVPAGDFRCFKYETAAMNASTGEHQGWWVIDCYSVNKGHIYSETFSLDSSGTVRSSVRTVLTRLTLK